MNNKMALVVHNSSNPWFEVKIMDGAGLQTSISSGDDLGRVLHYAAVMLGHPVIVPLSGPETSF